MVPNDARARRSDDGNIEIEHDEAVTQPWLSTRLSQRKRRYCVNTALIRQNGASAPLSFALHDRERHYVKRGGQKCCSGQDTHLSRSPSEFCRKNGFDRPLNMLQILSWFFFLADVLLGFVFLSPAFPTPTMIVFSVIFGGVSIAVLVIAWLVTKSDPADPLIFEEPGSEKYQSIDHSMLTQCDLCGPAMMKSKHCRACNKCVGNFDHHCKWLNNCIGEANYNLFLALIVLVGTMALLILAFGTAVLVSEATSQSVGPLWQSRMGWHNPTVIYVVVPFLMIVNIPLLCLDCQLVALHAYLMHKGLTTFEYITQRVSPPRTDDEEEHQTFCAEWIVIDKKRLKRARERMKTKSKDRKGGDNKEVVTELTSQDSDLLVGPEREVNIMMMSPPITLGMPPSLNDDGLPMDYDPTLTMGLAYLTTSSAVDDTDPNSSASWVPPPALEPKTAPTSLLAAQRSHSSLAEVAFADNSEIKVGLEDGELYSRCSSIWEGTGMLIGDRSGDETRAEMSSLFMGGVSETSSSPVLQSRPVSPPPSRPTVPRPVTPPIRPESFLDISIGYLDFNSVQALPPNDDQLERWSRPLTTSSSRPLTALTDATRSPLSTSRINLVQKQHIPRLYLPDPVAYSARSHVLPQRRSHRNLPLPPSPPVDDVLIEIASAGPPAARRSTAFDGRLISLGRNVRVNPRNSHRK